MSTNYERRPGEGAARRSGQDTDDGTALALPGLECPTAPEPWTTAMHRDAEEARRRRLAGARAALDAASTSWTTDAAWAIRQLAATGRPFTAEAIYERCGPPLGPSANAMGGLFSRAARAGIIRQHGWTIATRPSANGRGLRTWVGSGGAA